MSELTKLSTRVKELETEFVNLHTAFSKLEELVEAIVNVMYPPPMLAEVAIELSETMAEVKKLSKSSKESARNLRHAVVPQDDTISYKIVKEDKLDKV